MDTNANSDNYKDLADRVTQLEKQIQLSACFRHITSKPNGKNEHLNSFLKKLRPN
jgi:hypothetical protein